MYSIIDGKKISSEIKETIRSEVGLFNKKYGKDVTLAVVLVGNNPASLVYVKNKTKMAEYCGIKFLCHHLPEESSENQVIEVVKFLAESENVDGIFVQLPLPNHLDTDKIISHIPPEKDVDGFLPTNMGKLLIGQDCNVACTPSGIIELLKGYNITLSGKHAVIIGRSNIVGKPMAMLLLQEDCTVTICHSKTENLKEHCRKADIVICAVGKPNLLTADMVKEGAVVIDVGINKTDKGLTGDVDFINVKEKASYITPVPGGVGPMTVTMLMKNTLNCAEKRINGKL